MAGDEKNNKAAALGTSSDGKRQGRRAELRVMAFTPKRILRVEHGFGLAIRHWRRRPLSEARTGGGGHTA